MTTIQVNIPNIGTDALEVTEILIKIGDIININQPLLIIEGEKSSMEIPSPYSGIVKEIYVKLEDKVHTGSIIALININHQYTTTHNTSQNHQQSTTIQNLEQNLHDFKKNNHTKIIQDHNYQDLEYNPKFPPNYNYSTIHATPLIRRMARILEVDISSLNGSGRKGRITKEDIYNHLSMMPISHQYSNFVTTPNDPNSKTDSKLKTYSDNFENIHTIPLSKIQKISGFNLQKNWSTIPHVTQFDTVDITNLELFRKQQNLEISKNNVHYKITILAFVIKAVAKALEKSPRFNSSLSTDNQALILKKNINIGIAVDTKKGLLVPVLRHVNKKGILTLSQELSELVKKARHENQLTPADMKGGSFTISNLGSIGGTMFTPIINAPEVAILGISKSSIRPIWIKNKFMPRLMLPLSLSYDHRAIDGADGARFIHLINQFISDIRLLSM